VYPQNPKNGVFEVNLKISKFCSDGIHDDTDSRFVFKLHGNRPREVGETMRCFADKTLAKLRFFGASLAESAKRFT